MSSPGPAHAGSGALHILHADEALLVLHKPAGLLCVPGRGADKQDSLAGRAQARFADARVVHRLDQATSGLVLMALALQGQRALSRLFETRQVQKTYLAAVAGSLHATSPASPAAGADGWQTICLPLAADWPSRPRQKVDAVHGKPSETRWRALRAAELPFKLPPIGASHTWLELEPLTGRTHQLRVHLSAIGHPILGDALYAPAAVATATPRLMLHAWRLAFVHPQTGQACTFEAPWNLVQNGF